MSQTEVDRMFTLADRVPGPAVVVLCLPDGTPYKAVTLTEYLEATR